MADKVHIAADPIDTLDKPRFNFENVSYKHQREGARLQMKINHINRRVQDAGLDDDIDSLIGEFDTLVDQRDALLFAALEYVPQAWLIKTAPLASSIDWNDASSFQWLRSDKMQSLSKAKQDAENDSSS